MPLENPFGGPQQFTPPKPPEQPQVEQKWDTIPYYPSQRYVDKNLAPEKTLTTEDLFHLAKARQLAETQKVLPPELGQYILPMAMVEGWHKSYGIKDDLGLYAKPETLDRFNKMNLPVEQRAVEPHNSFIDIGSGLKQAVPWNGAQKNSSEDNIVSYEPIKRNNSFLTVDKDRMIGVSPYHPQWGDAASKARLMATILAEKHSLNKTGNPEDTIKLYNGRGKATEIVDGKPVPADTNVYLQKVREAMQMLHNPKNDRFRQYFEQAYRRKD